MELFKIVSGFVAGGGFAWLISWKIARKIQKVDFADRAVNFMAGQNDRLMKRVDKLEADVAKLMNFKCEKTDCPNRVPPKI